MGLVTSGEKVFNTFANALDLSLKNRRGQKDKLILHQECARTTWEGNYQKDSGFIRVQSGVSCSQKKEAGSEKECGPK